MSDLSLNLSHYGSKKSPEAAILLDAFRDVELFNVYLYVTGAKIWYCAYENEYQPNLLLEVRNDNIILITTDA